MATGVIRRPRDGRFDNFFFSGMAWLILSSVFVGFAQSYYLAGVFKAPLPNLLVNIHGAVFSCWILLLIVQTSLVTASAISSSTWSKRTICCAARPPLSRLPRSRR